MWRKKQTFLLAIVALCMALSAFFPIWTAPPRFADSESKALFPLHFSVTAADGARHTSYIPYCATAIFSIASATVAFIAMGRFENRFLQLKLSALNSLLMACSIVLAVYFARDLIGKYQEAGQYELGLVLFAVAMLSNIAANRFIRRAQESEQDAKPTH